METKVDNEQISVSVKLDEAVSVYISAKDRYNYSRLVVKVDEDEYLEIGYNWKGEKYIPTFVMELMGFIKGSSATKAQASKGSENVYENKDELLKYEQFLKEE